MLQAQQAAVSRQYSVAFEQEALLAKQPTVLSFTTLERAQAVAVIDRGLGAPTSRTARTVMGFAVGTAVGFAVAVLLGRLDRKIRTREQAEEVMGMRARVAIPRVRDERRNRVVVTRGRHDLLSDSYRTLRNVVSFVLGGLEPVDRARIALVVSPGPGDGKTSLAVNLAAAFVERGQQTIAVNTDFRRPTMMRAFTDDRVLPLPFFLEDLDKVDSGLLLYETENPLLHLVDLSTLGSASELARATARLLPRLAQRADAIVVDTSPVGATAEVLELVPVADVIIVVARVGHTQIAAAEKTIGILRDLTTVPMLLVVTGVKPERTGYDVYGDRRLPDVRSLAAGPEPNGLKRWLERLRPAKPSTNGDRSTKVVSAAAKAEAEAEQRQTEPVE